MLEPQAFDLTGLAADIRRFRDRRNWRQFHRPKELAAALSIEAGELQELFLWRGDESSADVRTDNQRMAAVADEVADVSIYLMLFAIELEIDLADSIRKKLARNEDRFPQES
jgi:NTP pyrophosphatase (non-canonical NTP hydrolase)